jgi:hypothetical protein
MSHLDFLVCFILTRFLFSVNPELLLQTVLVLKDILRRFPDAAAPYANTLQTLPVAELQTNEAVAAYFWIRAQLTCMGILEEEGVEPVRVSCCHASSLLPGM